MRIETIAARAAHSSDPATGAVTAPIHLSTTFERDPDGEFSRGYVYSRTDNPNRHALEGSPRDLEGGVEAADDRGDAVPVAARVKLFTRATSLGGTESLIEHRTFIEGPDTKTPDNLLGVSCGLENVDDLIEDLAQALG